MNVETNPVHLKVKDLCKYYPLKGGFFEEKKGVVKAVDGLSFTVHSGEVFGLVGESGCGKTTTGRLILNVLELTAGHILFRNDQGETINLTYLKKRELRTIRQKIQMIFQDPYASLDPRMTIMQIIGEPLRANKLASGSEYKDRIVEAMKKVRLQPEMMNRYPHAFSGGQRQRIGIARALITGPGLMVADEPVSALDVSVQAQILNLLRSLQEEMNLTLIFIGHDLGVIRYICDTVAVMYLGRLVEVAGKSDFYTLPRHPYSELLFDAVPGPHGRRRSKNKLPNETIGDAANPPSGCYFHPRCHYRKDICKTESPLLRTVAQDHSVACHFDLNLKGI
jgi:peptide/nickel transport system ATP-binding protein